MDIHELANITAIISGNIELLKARCDTCDKSQGCESCERISETFDATKRLVDLIKREFEKRPAGYKGGVLELPNGDKIVG